MLKIDSVYKQSKNYHPQVYVKECKKLMLRASNAAGLVIKMMVMDIFWQHEEKKCFCNLAAGYKKSK